MKPYAHTREIHANGRCRGKLSAKNRRSIKRLERKSVRARAKADLKNAD